MTTIRFLIDQSTLKKTLTADDIETIELFQEGEQIGTYRIKRMAARFIVDDNDQPVPYKKALQIFGALNAEEYSETLIKFIQTMSETALPKANGTQSKPLSEVAPASTSPDG